jgi:hypothetical protein
MWIFEPPHQTSSRERSRAFTRHVVMEDPTVGIGMNTECGLKIRASFRN